MVNPGPDQPSYGQEHPSLEKNTPPANPYPPVDYPTDDGMPPAYPPPYDQPQPGAQQAYPPPPGYPPPPPTFQQYPPAYPYGGYDPYGAARPVGTNGKAIAALVTSLVGLLFCGLPSIVGLILGVMGMKETKRTGQEGYGLALAGVIVGAISAVGWLLYGIFIVFLIAVSAGTNNF